MWFAKLYLCTFFIFLYMFLVNQQFISHNFLLCRPSKRSARSKVPSQAATHQKIGSQLWAGETPDSNPGLQDNSQAEPPCLPKSHHASQRAIMPPKEPPCLPVHVHSIHTWAAIPCITSKNMSILASVLGLDWAPHQLSSILYLLCLSQPTQQLVIFPNDSNSHVHPHLTTRWLNTAIQVNNMGAWHLMYNRHIYIT